MYALWLGLFATTVGFTASGIIANLYRLSGLDPETGSGRTVRLVAMVIAGPSVIFEAAMRGLLQKEWTVFAFSLAAGLVAYWSFVIGLFVINLAFVLPI